MKVKIVILALACFALGAAAGFLWASNAFKKFSIAKEVEVVARVNPFLARIPGRSPTSTCKSALCRLDDLRLGRLGLATNFPASRTAAK